MAKKQQSSKDSSKKNSTNHVILGLLFVLIAILAAGGIAGGAGAGGFLVASGVRALFGAGSVIFPLGFGTAGVLLMLKRPLVATTKKWVTGILGVLSLLALCTISNPVLGGLVGKVLAVPLIAAFDTTFSAIILAFLAAGSLIVFFDHTPKLFPFFMALWAKAEAWWARLFSRAPRIEEDVNTIVMDEMSAGRPAPQEIEEAPKEKPAVLKVTDPSTDDFVVSNFKKSKGFGGYTPPPLSLLEGDRGKANVGDVKANANVIRRTLMNFGIEVEMDEVTIGPTVTRYALKPAQGVKLSRIVGLQNDLALSLAAHPLRIEAPIPGKSLVGIEIPNKTKSTVGLSSLLSDPAFQQSRPLTIALGRNIGGKSVLKSIAKMPHLLIAGTTGSGKSVTIHSIITSLLYKHGPDELRFIFVDPKRVELTLYNGIPHLLTPVITESKKAILALKWAATEMNRRYDILESESVRDIDSYHKKYASVFAKPADTDEDGGPDRMPYIVIIIDELADIMQAFPRELEAAIVRLAQMSRAVGIHLILSTQRPEVNIITGLIKANVPARLALRVPTGIDSRTILDTTGAEKLLGNGDALALIESNQPERVQNGYISEEEVKEVVKYLKNTFKDDIRDQIELSGVVAGEKPMWGDSMESGDDDDALYEDARAAIMEAGKASTSYIQRKLKVGYARAARLMDMLEERGVIGPSDGAKPREVLSGGIKNSVSDQVAEDMGI